MKANENTSHGDGAQCPATNFCHLTFVDQDFTAMDVPMFNIKKKTMYWQFHQCIGIGNINKNWHRYWYITRLFTTQLPILKLQN